MNDLSKDPFRSTFPLPSTTTYNTNGLSFGSARNGCIMDNIRELAKNNDIIALQETHLAEISRELSRGVKEHLVYFNNWKSDSCGVATLVNKKWEEKYTTTPVTPPPSLQGRVLSLRFDPRPAQDGENEAQSFTFSNVYVMTGSTPDVTVSRLALFKFLADTSRDDDHYILAGDFNFPTSLEDSASRKEGLPSSIATGWNDLIGKLDPCEARQDSHT